MPPKGLQEWAKGGKRGGGGPMEKNRWKERKWGLGLKKLKRAKKDVGAVELVQKLNSCRCRSVGLNTQGPGQ